MTIYNFDDGQLDFDFDSTTPPVFRIVAGLREGRCGVYATADFRAARVGDPDSVTVTVWSGASEDEAVALLLEHLREKYTVAPAKCRMCDGTGTCQICDGTGRCNECDSEGCDFCDGDGFCIECEGSGRCIDCAGTGDVIPYVTEET
jgi:predicted Zn-ribbon and HTH transcriptional regulator